MKVHLIRCLRKSFWDVLESTKMNQNLETCTNTKKSLNLRLHIIYLQSSKKICSSRSISRRRSLLEKSKSALSERSLESLAWCFAFPWPLSFFKPWICFLPQILRKMTVEPGGMQELASVLLYAFFVYSFLSLLPFHAMELKVQENHAISSTQLTTSYFSLSILPQPSFFASLLPRLMLMLSFNQFLWLSLWSLVWELTPGKV